MRKRLITVFFTFSAAMIIGASSTHASEGEEAYQRCVACHQPDGAGIPGIFPALKNRFADMTVTTQGRDYVTMVLIDGLFGTIQIDGQNYVGAMPAQGLNDAQIATVINYILSNFTEPGTAASKKALNEEEIAQIRSRYAGADAQSALDLRALVPGLNTTISP